MNTKLKDALSAIDTLLKDESKQPDEFTVAEYNAHAKERGKSLTEDQTRNKFNRLVASGTLSKRHLMINGRLTSVYRFASGADSTKP